MALTLGEAAAVNTVARWIIGTEKPDGEKVTDAEARESLVYLAERAHASLGAGVLPTEVRRDFPVVA